MAQPDGSSRKRRAEEITVANQIIELADSATDSESAAVAALALERSLENVKKRLGQTWHPHKGAKRPGELIYHPEYITIGGRRDLTAADFASPDFKERFGAKVGDRVMPNEDWVSERKSLGLFGPLETKSSHEILRMRPKCGVIVSLDDDGGNAVSVQWEDGDFTWPLLWQGLSLDSCLCLSQDQNDAVCVRLCFPYHSELTRFAAGRLIPI